MTQAVEQIAAFIRFRQVPEGIFSYEFLPGRDAYWPEEQNWIRQAATTWALALHARVSQEKASARACAQAIGAFEKMIKPLPGVSGAQFVATPDDKHALGTTALIVLALIDSPERDRHAGLRRSLLEAIASLQRYDGGFRTAFPPAPSTGSQDYYPGEALLAIVRHYELDPDVRWRDLCDKSLLFYQDYFRQERPPMFVPWQSQAWGHLARQTRLRKYAEFVFEMSDQIAATAIAWSDPTLPIYNGGFDVHGDGSPGVSTAVYVEGLVEAIRTAEAFGEKEYAARYREATKNAARFVLQLCWRSEECYYVRTPKNVLGGVRNTMISPTLRIDNMQHGLAAFMGVLEVDAVEKPIK